jgi:hypothetical protein
MQSEILRKFLLALVILLVILVVSLPSLGQQQNKQSAISIKACNWNGKEHSIESLKKGIQKSLNELGVKPENIRVELSVEVNRLWIIREDGQYIAMNLQSILTIIQASNSKSFTIPVDNLVWRHVSNQGGMSQTIVFKTYQIAQDICKGTYPEDKLWELTSKDLSDKINQMLIVTVTYLRKNSLKGIELLLSNKGLYLGESAVYLLGEIKTRDAVTLLQNISANDENEHVRSVAKEILEKLGNQNDLRN